MAAGSANPRADEFNVSAPGANTDILAAAITPSMTGYFHIFVVLATSSVFNMTETRSGTTFTIGLNKSGAVSAGDGYSFCVPVSASSAYNFQVETDGVIRVLRVYEVAEAPGGLNAQGFQA